MKKGTLTWLLLVFFAFGCKGQTENTENISNPSQRKGPVGGGCDGCELMYVGIPKEINATDTSAGWYEEKKFHPSTGCIDMPFGHRIVDIQVNLSAQNFSFCPDHHFADW